VLTDRQIDKHTEKPKSLTFFNFRWKVLKMVNFSVNESNFQNLVQSLVQKFGAVKNRNGKKNYGLMMRFQAI
jgi:hypothetical protein